MEEMVAEIEALRKENAEQRAQLAALSTQLAKLNERISELRVIAQDRAARR